MKNIILSLILMVGVIAPLWAAVQTDTHTYIVGSNENAVLAINRQTGQETRIPVGQYPLSMVIHKDQGYVVNWGPNTVSVIDLTTNTVSQIIPVGLSPQSMVIHEDQGYVVNLGANTVSVINLTTNTVIHTIPVGERPQSIVIHGGMGYVVNLGANTVSVIDLTTNMVTQTFPGGSFIHSMVIDGEKGYMVNWGNGTVSVLDLKTHTLITTIKVGRNPRSMVLHVGLGYVVNWGNGTVSVLDLKTHTLITTIKVGRNPDSIVIHGGLGYVVSDLFHNVSLIDLTTNKVIGAFDIGQNRSIDFSDTHVYLGLTKARPLYPTLASIMAAKANETLDEFKTIMPDVFKLGEIEQRMFPKEENQFDLLPPYQLAQDIFWDRASNMPIIDPKDILATLVIMKYPQRFLQTEAGQWLRNRLHTAFFQTVWAGNKKKAKAMLTYFVQLQDPVITKLAKYHFKIGAGVENGMRDALDEAPTTIAKSAPAKAVKKAVAPKVASSSTSSGTKAAVKKPIVKKDDKKK